MQSYLKKLAVCSRQCFPILPVISVPGKRVAFTFYCCVPCLKRAKLSIQATQNKCFEGSMSEEERQRDEEEREGEDKLKEGEERKKEK